MALNNRVTIPQDLVPHLKREAESLLLTDNPSDAVNWCLRKYFQKKAANGGSPSRNPKAEDLENYDDMFTK